MAMIFTNLGNYSDYKNVIPGLMPKTSESIHMEEDMLKASIAQRRKIQKEI